MCERLLTLGVMVWLALGGTAQAVDRNNSVSIVYTQTSRYEPQAWVNGHDRFPNGAALQTVTGGAGRALVAGFFASADAEVSFDATHVLFAGKRTAAEPWQIWEIALAGGTPRQITNEKMNCVRPSYLPDDRIVYTRQAGGESALEVVGLAGGAPARLTFTPLPVLGDQVLPDGRILFEMALGKRELFTVYPDGTSVESVRCDHGPDRSEARQVSSGDFVFTVGSRLARFAPDSAVQGAVEQPDGDVVGPVAEVAPGDWIVTRREKSGRFVLYRGNEPIAHDKASAVQPVIVAPRVPPKRFPSALVPTRSWGNLLCLDARVSKLPLPASEVTLVRAYTLDAGKQEVLLGQAPVERDGSFYVQLPADRPLRLELADSAGRSIRAEHDWFWMRPAEQRVCVGCHAGPERSPENKVPEVLLRSTVPVKMMGASGHK